MSLTDTVKIELKYGQTGDFQCEIPSERVICYHQSPEPLSDVKQKMQQALNSPLELPPLNLAIVPGDKITILVDPQAPEAWAIIDAVWAYLLKCGISIEDLTILQAAIDSEGGAPDLQNSVSDELQHQANWVVHNPESQDDLGYLGTSTGGERIYLSRHLLEADFILPIEKVGYDPLIGYAGGGSSLYPGFSSMEAIVRSRGQSHRELTPSDSRPLRQLIDEVGWMLGLQYSLQVIPAGGQQAADIIFGSLEAAFRKGKELLDLVWRVEPEYKAEMILVAIESGPAGHQWNQLGSVLETARNLVTQDGRVVLLTQIDADFGEGMQLLASCHEPLDAIKPLRDKLPLDLVAATQLALAGDWALVCLLSQADSDRVEDLFIIPLEDEAEIRRLLQTDETVTVIASAQHTYGQLKQD